MTGGDRGRLRLLIAEDSEDDAILVLRQLRQGGYEPDMRRVDSAADMQEALNEQGWDLVIADHNMPQFDSLEALTLIRQHDPNIPFILVSGSIGEEVAVDAMKAGANDYVMKNNLTRLLPAIDRELREADNRRAHQEAQARIHHMAFHDSLTELHNRAEFERRVAAVVESSRGNGESHALLYLDLDQFKLVNDSCGHLAGDELLRRLARLLQLRIRDSDTLARLGGDEFGVLLKDCPMDRAERIAQGMLNGIRDYVFVWGERTFKVGGSIGLVRITGDEDIQALLSLSDMACYAAKRRGGNRLHVYAEGDRELAARRGEMLWIQRLREAISQNDLMLYRQRIQSLNGAASHDELLLRMRGEDGEIITPDRFIPAAERYNLMPEIDRWVIRRACHQLRQNGSTSPRQANAANTVFINLSATSLSDESLIDFIHKQMRHNSLKPANVGFEITETAAISDLDCATALIRSLRELGCKVALDDFGTGMSSFAYLKNLQADFLKIDGGFVRNMLEDDMDSAIVESISKIGRISGMRTIAEFVETDAILARLRDIGVNYAQGWAVERPTPFSEAPVEDLH